MEANWSLARSKSYGIATEFPWKVTAVFIPGRGCHTEQFGGRLLGIHWMK